MRDDHDQDDPPGAGGVSISAVEQLLGRMRSGDRNAAAEFMARFAPRIRRRVRGQLRPSMRRIFDSQEILSTVARRLDLFILAGRLTASSESQLWSLVFTMAHNAVVDKTRVFERLRSREQRDELALLLHRHLTNAESEAEDGSILELERVFAELDDQVDCEILSLWLHDTPHNATAQVVDLTPAAVRKRWQHIRERLQQFLSNGSTP